MPTTTATPAQKGTKGLGPAVLALVLLAACEPTVRIEPPKEPITINLNIKIDAEVRVKLEEKAQQDIKANPGVF